MSSALIGGTIGNVCGSAIADPACRDRVPVPTAPIPDFVQNRITLGGASVLNNHNRVRLAMTAQRIRIGCTEITIEAAQFIMDEHRARFGEPAREHVLQD